MYSRPGDNLDDEMNVDVPEQYSEEYGDEDSREIDYPDTETDNDELENSDDDEEQEQRTWSVRRSF